MENVRKIRPKIGFISLAEPPRALSFADELNKYIFVKHNEFKDYLNNNEVEVIDASELAQRPDNPENILGFYSSKDVQKAVDVFNANHIEAVIVGCWHWTDPMFIVELARSLNKPILLYGEENPAWAAPCLIAAGGASLWDNSPNRFAQVHERIYGNRDSVLKWVRGVTILEKLKRGKLLLWGGSYALRMEFLQDDYPYLKSFLLGDILTEDQYVLIKYAEQVSSERIDKFINWLKQGGAKLNFDNLKFTPEVLRKQAALYLGAKDRIKELGDDIIGVSVKCFNEMSDVYGVVPCFLPAFIPFDYDSEGDKKQIPAVCEGDTKGLISSILLSYFAGGTPALFGDVTSISRNYYQISNCGASSVYYACKSCKVNDILKNLTFEANSEGASGAAVGYDGFEADMTVIRLVRSKGRYFMHYGLGTSIEMTKSMKDAIYFGKTNPHTAIRMDVDKDLFINALGANHLTAIPGNYLKETEYFCRQVGFEMFRIDSNDSINDWLKRVHYL
ncbi:MAG: fucose isomerase [Candidatus Humimicrobiaceae bacterium]